VRAGIERVEVASFANPARVPQMADAEAVIAGLAGTTMRPIGLVLNERGLDRALATGIGEINTVVVVTDTFSRENQGMSTAEAAAMSDRVARRARDAGRCERASRCRRRSAARSKASCRPTVWSHSLGRPRTPEADEIALADTIGAAVPNQTEDLVAAVAEATRVPDPGSPAQQPQHRPGQRGGCNTWGRDGPRRQHRRDRRLPVRGPAPPATSPPKTSSTCSRAWASRQERTSNYCCRR
jgi:hydroxymethylglutaryl-CoA lyase